MLHYFLFCILVRRLCHPNIVRLMAASRTPSYFLLANEYIHGATLDAVLHMDNCFIKVPEIILQNNDFYCPTDVLIDSYVYLHTLLFFTGCVFLFFFVCFFCLCFFKQRNRYFLIYILNLLS